MDGGVAAAAYLDGKYQLRRDLHVIWRLKKAEWAWKKAVKEDRVSPWYLLHDVTLRQPDDRAIWTQLCDETMRYAQWLLDQGVRPGELVGVYLVNCAEYLTLLFAAHSIGASLALLNWNLEGKPLLHCLSVCDCRILVVDSDEECRQRVEASCEDIKPKIVVLDEQVKADVSARKAVVPPAEMRNGMSGDWPYCIIFSSGTTGLPKGCTFPVSRFWETGFGLDPPFGAVPGKDFWYNPMPLYHGTGMMISTSGLLSGCGVGLAPKFSVSRFWPDIHDSGATMFVYVGETARYLLAAPHHPLERQHKVRLAHGNGLRPDVWKKFQDRFNIAEVAEFFNSSEGMLAMYVWDRGPYLQACVGHHGGILRFLLRNVYIPVKIDYETGDIWRDPKTGFAQRVPYEEGGEILVAVPSRDAFAGYWNNAEATDKRFATDVFKKGDVYYRSGDALRRSPDGHWAFMDRLGDTYRWKSENVSTAEVSEVMGRFDGVGEANVYGVVVPGHEGRAGCAALHLSREVDSTFLSSLLTHCRRNLPRYAVPVFLRIVTHSSHIHNHKQNKVGLRNEGVDPDARGKHEPDGADDDFFWLAPGSETWIPFERKDWDKLVYGSARL
ncbi:fatty-acyl-CoA synthase [Piedraia hortae CBS 480.64]|uniref:Fatty-acyl-CoA synthase n=1 Tax=Piedraia hortae CBS 480.64 TaxID=1314780 RepID=A0A6A7CBP4_9PEZI|nr:fatty-acyl-CoA synthase [Piedraia hortae CBS 480.64]